MNAKRLLKVAELAARIPSNDLDMNLWGCGTPQCIMGHATQDPYFRKQGLRAEKEHHGPEYSPWYKQEFGFAAIQKFFGIDQKEAESLFLGEKYRNCCSGKECARKIRKFVEKRQKVKV
jgi:hypothetical protein